MCSCVLAFICVTFRQIYRHQPAARCLPLGFALIPGFADTCEVEMFGVGGRTVDKAIHFDLEAISSTAPNVVILELGSNDVCDRDSDADSIASSLAA